MVVFFFRAGDGDGEAAVAAVVEVPVVPCCCVQETTNAMPIRTVIMDKTDFFIDMVNVDVFQNVVPQSGCKKIICIRKPGR